MRPPSEVMNFTEMYIIKMKSIRFLYFRQSTLTRATSTQIKTHYLQPVYTNFPLLQKHSHPPPLSIHTHTHKYSFPSAIRRSRKRRRSSYYFPPRYLRFISHTTTTTTAKSIARSVSLVCDFFPRQRLYIRGNSGARRSIKKRHVVVARGNARGYRLSCRRIRLTSNY